MIDEKIRETSIRWLCIAASEAFLGEYLCEVSDSTGYTVTKVVNLWCEYQSRVLICCNY